MFSKSLLCDIFVLIGFQCYLCSCLGNTSKEIPPATPGKITEDVSANCYFTVIK